MIPTITYIEERIDEYQKIKDDMQVRIYELQTVLNKIKETSGN